MKWKGFSNLCITQQLTHEEADNLSSQSDDVKLVKGNVEQWHETVKALKKHPLDHQRGVPSVYSPEHIQFQEHRASAGIPMVFQVGALFSDRAVELVDGTHYYRVGQCWNQPQEVGTVPCKQPSLEEERVTCKHTRLSNTQPLTGCAYAASHSM